MDPAEAVKKALERGANAALVTVKKVEGDAPSAVGMKLAVDENGTIFGTLGCDGFDSSGVSDALRSLAEEAPLESKYPWHQGAAISVEVRPYRPGERVQTPDREIPELLIVGQGPVARALVALGEPLGFHVRVAAGPDSPKVGDFDGFDGADEVILATEVRDVEALRPNGNTYVVICGHDQDFSIPVLRKMIKSNAPYIGMMGSRRHTGAIYDELKAEGFGDEAIAKVHTPVGLDLGAETPEEIALSVLAQVIAVRRGGSGRPLHLAP